MIKIPAIDIIKGQCVRLVQGDYAKKDTYNEDPFAVAQDFYNKGIRYIHVVDLDSALSGKRENKEVIKKIAELLNVELGGGIRSMENIEDALSLGVQKVIIGTKAVKDPDFVSQAVAKYGDKIIVSIDAKGGYVATDGWTKVLDVKALDFALDMEKRGVKNIVYTDIATDGMLKGPNYNELLNLKDNVNIDITASGGVSCIDDVNKLSEYGFYGVIVGKAIYENRIKVEELL